ncbi:hypothetical protein BC830DRAFT_1077256 [Chytriomyces sp. MP71]|nr:hypothetical protein BC830DRAFT_1077256 [Chytriomyces sp. MP71]
MFKFGNRGSNQQLSGPPTGEIATSIIVQEWCLFRSSNCVSADVATNPLGPEVEWGAVFSTVELIKGYYSTSTPNEGCNQALKAIKFRLTAEDPIAINYTLQVLDAFYKSCDAQFVAQVASKDFLKFLKAFLERPSLAAENRGQCLELIADWGTTTPLQTDMRKFFEALIKEGFKFSDSALSKLPPGTVETLMSQGSGLFGVGGRSFSNNGATWGAARPQVLQPYIVNQVPMPFQQAAPAQPKINEVSHSERVKWVNFDLSVADNCVTMLHETLNFAEGTTDVGQNEIARETFMRCCDIQKRLVSSIARVPEPDLLEKLLSKNANVNDALEAYNNRRLTFLKRSAEASDALIDFTDDLGNTLPDSRAGPSLSGYTVGGSAGASSSKGPAEDPFGDGAAVGSAGPSLHKA